MIYPGERRISELAEELDAEVDSDLIEEWNRLSAKEHSLEAELDCISDAVLELMRVVLRDLAMSNGICASQADPYLKDADLQLIQEADRVIFVDQWRIKTELDEIRRSLDENEERIKEQAEKRRKANMMGAHETPAKRLKRK